MSTFGGVLTGAFSTGRFFSLKPVPFSFISPLFSKI
jgi:hypothetical protein